MFTNIQNLPEPVVKALSSDDYSSGAVNSSVTTLIDSPQIKILSRKHQDLVNDLLFPYDALLVKHVCEKSS